MRIMTRFLKRYVMSHRICHVTTPHPTLLPHTSFYHTEHILHTHIPTPKKKNTVVKKFLLRNRPRCTTHHEVTTHHFTTQNTFHVSTHDNDVMERCRDKLMQFPRKSFQYTNKFSSHAQHVS